MYVFVCFATAVSLKHRLPNGYRNKHKINDNYQV